MAGYGWNYGPRPSASSSSPQIACRICNQVFMSRQALIEHIESHLTCQDSVSATQTLMQNLLIAQRNPFINPSQASLPPTMPFTLNTYVYPAFLERNAALAAASVMVSQGPTSEAQMAMLQAARSHYAAGSQQMPFPYQLQRRPIEESAVFCTKPLLQLLDKPLPLKSELNAMAEDNGSDDLDLDLNLKL